MMADNTHGNAKNELVPFAVQTEPLTAATVRHDPSFITQLLAHGAGLANLPQRRRSDRAVPMAAYTSAPPQESRTRRIV